MRKRKILFFINHATFFVSHRLPIALKALEKGDDVYLIVGQEPSDQDAEHIKEKIQKLGINLYRVSFTASFKNIGSEIHGIIQAFSVVKRINPDLVHCASPKGNLYGGIIAGLLKINCLVLSISGLGYLFTRKDNFWLKFVNFIYKLFFSYVVKHKNFKAIVQNLDDKNLLTNVFGINESNIEMIKGSGVDLSKYGEFPLNKKKKYVLMASRPVFNKGVEEFIYASKELKKKYPEWNFLFAGGFEYDSPDQIPIEIIQKWKSEKNVKFLGHVKDMETLYNESSIVCLPSYREGFPKTLMEAAASGNAIVTTDVTGCRDCVVPNKNAILVNVGDKEELQNAIEVLIINDNLRFEFAKFGMNYAKENFCLNDIVSKNLIIYDKLCDQ